jgi:3-hydroxyacyl-CoA dehydrogenase
MSERQFKKVGVIGAGVMGSNIAAMLAGAGVRVELLDAVSDPSSFGHPHGEHSHAESAISRMAKAFPPALYCGVDAKRIRPGNLDEHPERVAECDWIIECVVERLDAKHKLFERLFEIIGPETIVTSNTSGFSWRALTEGMDGDFKRRFFITHFFNPPRYMKLVEIISGSYTETGALDAVRTFMKARLGKGTVVAKDTPGFIANRIGVFHAMDIMHLTYEKSWPLEAVDAVMGRAIGRPSTGVFRTADMVGLDTLTFAAEHIVKGCPDDEWVDRVRIPQYLQQMIVKGLTGDKSDGGFFRKDKSGSRLTLDTSKHDYRPSISFSTPSIVASKGLISPAERIRSIVFADDQASEIAWPSISNMLIYAANRLPEISDDIISVDRALRWGYRWELGPFEIWDALGVTKIADIIEQGGGTVPRIVCKLLASGHDSFYDWDGAQRLFFDISSGQKSKMDDSIDCVQLPRIKSSDGLVENNGSASIVDVGDGLFACEFHTKMNTIDDGIASSIYSALDRVERDGTGLILINDGRDFSVGVNLKNVMELAESKRWSELDRAVREFQALCQRIRFASKPVLAAPAGRALGGGAELSLACGQRLAAMESYIGLVEVGVGLVPAGGGCKNLMLALEGSSPKGPFPKVGQAFELIARAAVSSSARDAQRMGYLSRGDGIVLDREEHLLRAKEFILNWSKNFVKQEPVKDIALPGSGGKMALINAVRAARNSGVATEYDEVVATKLAHVLAGGDADVAYVTDEDHILDLEREAFLSLLGEERTRDRIVHTLKTGRPLRN